MLYRGIGDFVWASGNGLGEVGGSREKFNGREGRAEGRVRLLRAHGSTELGKVASLWLFCAGPLAGRQKSISQVIGKDQSRLPGRGTVGEVRRGGRRASDRTKERDIG